MRFHLIGVIALAFVAIPAAAQRAETPEKRIERLEQELRAVQRKVFSGAGQYVSPEVTPQAAAASPVGVPATSAVADLTARLDAIETQLRALTGQAEENSNRLRLVEQAGTRLQESLNARIDALEQAKAEPAPVVEPKRQVAATNAAAGSAAATPEWVSARSSGTAEAAYNDGFHLWEQKRYADAIPVLEKVVRDYPGDRWASWAGNLAGRAYLDDGKPAAAAKAFLGNYQANPKGERAADSLYFLGQSLMKLKRPTDACKAYDELQDVYGATIRDWLRQRLPAARAEAKCR